MSWDGKDLLNLARQSDVLDNEVIRRMILAAGLSGNERIQDSARKVLLGKSVHHWQHPFSSQTSLGTVELGETFRGRSYYLAQKALAKHVLAVGQSGSGKTTLFYNLMDQVSVPFWAFDLKRDYRHLVREGDVLVLPWSELCLNPLVPPSGVPPRRWAQVFTEMLGHSTALLSGSKNYLLKKVVHLFQLYDLFESVEPPFPSLHELQRLLESDKMNYVRKSADYRDTVLNRLESMNLVAGTVFDCSEGFALEELLQRDVVFEFDGLSRDIQDFLMEILVAWVYEYRLAQNHRDSDLRHLFFLDEGKRVFSVYKERQDAAGIPEVDELTARMREFGEGLVVADQEASKLTDSIKANTYTKVLLPVGSQREFGAIADSMNLTDRQREYAQSLDVGEAVVQQGNGEPAPVNLFNYELEKSVDDRELERMQRKYWEELDSTPRKTTSGFDVYINPGEREVEDPLIPDDPGQQQLQVSDDGQRFLRDVVENPFKRLTSRYDGFSSSYKGNKAKDEVVDRGLVFERKVRTGNRQRKLLELTEKGREYVESELGFDLKTGGRGGVVHRYWQHRLMKLFEEAGWNPHLEKLDADVYVNFGWMELAIEVAMGNNQREIDHIKKHLEKGLDAVWMFCRNQEIREGLVDRLKEEGLDLDRVVFRLFRELNDVEIPKE
jgi:DNA-binding PadR family transcriptional regulator